ncbi:uncharacterized protein BJ171DRAFT_594652 [Polychytrium aggregatum]|uniref:uncharacterized protein n=1 Tax=Polychytrium aggregatum TaxID=110093 RepID=UPI0022FDD5C6|nr:uncharacterized protein BJ171DRAFT_594652 [Polychytrium aggregatum]KAI9209615.1 hypothetical protein BJ171DRAFT_594652 [Polychytrium aggregatum]
MISNIDSPPPLDICSMIISPEKGTKKRRRHELEIREADSGMDLDGKGRAARSRSVNDLTSQELAVAQTVAIERLQQVLYVDIQYPFPGLDNTDAKSSPPATPTSRLRFEGHKSVSVSMNLDCDSRATPPAFVYIHHLDVFVPSALHHLVQFLQAHGLDNPGLFRQQGDFAKIAAIRKTIDQDGAPRAIERLHPADCIEVGTVLLNLLKEDDPILNTELHVAFKSILALNNSSSQRLPGSRICHPNQSTIRLLRDCLLLLAPSSRQSLQFLLDFLCQVLRRSSTTFKSRILGAVRLSAVVGPVLVGLHQIARPSSSHDHNKASFLLSTPVRQANSDWASNLAELLMYANGLVRDAPLSARPLSSPSPSPSPMSYSVLTLESALWRTNPTLEEAIHDHALLVSALGQRTPTKKSLANMTPKRKSRHSHTGAVNSSPFAAIKGSPVKPLGISGICARNLFAAPKPLALTDCLGTTSWPGSPVHSPTIQTRQLQNFLHSDGLQFTKSGHRSDPTSHDDLREPFPKRFKLW